MTERKINVLLVDDDDVFRKVISKELSILGFNVNAIRSGKEVIQRRLYNEFDVIILDMRMPDLNGEELLKIIKDSSSSTEVIILTAYGNIGGAVNCIKAGAYNYLVKPCSLEELESTIKKAYEKKKLEEENVRLKLQIARKEYYPDVIGKSKEIKKVLDLVSQVAPTNSTVLIEGESGVGKEVIARLIHKKSNRQNKPFVTLDCGAYQESLLQSELFGHEKGSFTGATQLKYGLFEIADGGTIFLDEVGVIPTSFQIKLLGIIEKGTFMRVGGVKEIKVDVRVIVATNTSLKELVKEGKFREDLFYRLNVFNIWIPPLRMRKEDIPLLAEYFIEKLVPPGGEKKKLSDEVLKIFNNYSWPGNVRELRNIIERLLIISKNEVISASDLPSDLIEENRESFLFLKEDVSLKEMEKKYISYLLNRFGGNRRQVADVLGISERNLYRKIKKYNFD
ncbi:MAG: sigma-54 dependent transcriptional regulator [Acidobacteriota bacterium]